MKVNYKWIFTITLFAFLISFAFSFLAEMIMPNVSVFVGILLVIFFVFLGIFFDIIGVAVTVAEESRFHSMSSKKVRGASIAVKLKKNADKVSSFCNDVIGDVCGVISGSAGVYIATKLSSIYQWDLLLTNLIVMAMIAALTIGGKAFGKGYAINHSETILYEISKYISFVYKK